MSTLYDIASLYVDMTLRTASKKLQLAPRNRSGDMNQVPVTCPHCSHTVQISESHTGQFNCEKCKAIVHPPQAGKPTPKQSSKRAGPPGTTGNAEEPPVQSFDQDSSAQFGGWAGSNSKVPAAKLAKKRVSPNQYKGLDLKKTLNKALPLVVAVVITIVVAIALIALLAQQ